MNMLRIGQVLGVLLVASIMSVGVGGCASTAGTVVSDAQPLTATPAWPFDANRAELYSRDELWKGYDSDPAKNESLDWRLFEYFTKKSKYNPSVDELRAQRSHDAGMDHAINRFLNVDDSGVPTRGKVIVIMGSHSRLRNDDSYRNVARLAFELTVAGYYVVTGGGPGLMEASHVGVYMSAYGAPALEDALAILGKSSVPRPGSPLKQYEMADYWAHSLEVVNKYPDGASSLGLPTWFYGHEGANAFSLHVAKYFSNAQREEKICALGLYGAIFAEGGPGTQQEAFMDAAENGYASYNWYSPMVFFSTKQDAKDMQALIERATSPEYRALNMVTVTTDRSAVIEFLRQHVPVRRQ